LPFPPRVTSIVKRRGCGPKTGQAMIALRIDAPCGRAETTWQIAGAAEACGY
jgi:hypothetical protein